MLQPPKFSTKFLYTNRKTKSNYVWLKYQSILKNSVLDVGADECHIMKYLNSDVKYTGIGMSGSLDVFVNLERGYIPFKNDMFDCVLCLDVLEHVENIHDVFDELCRVSRKYVIISLPNPWKGFYSILGNGPYDLERSLKYYNLPKEAPEDRHKWFYSPREANEFVRYRASKNNMRVLQIDWEGTTDDGKVRIGLLRRLLVKVLFHKSITTHDLYAGNMWVVLEKIESS